MITRRAALSLPAVLAAGLVVGTGKADDTKSLFNLADSPIRLGTECTYAKLTFDTSVDAGRFTTKTRIELHDACGKFIETLFKRASCGDPVHLQAFGGRRIPHHVCSVGIGKQRLMVIHLYTVTDCADRAWWPEHNWQSRNHV